MPFVKLDKPIGIAKLLDPAFITIHKYGVIGFSAQCSKTYSLQKYKYAILYYDPDCKRIGITFTNDETENGIKKMTVKGSNPCHGSKISGLGLLNHYGIKAEKTKRYIPVKEGNMLVISLGREL